MLLFDVEKKNVSPSSGALYSPYGTYKTVSVNKLFKTITLLFVG